MHSYLSKIVHIYLDVYRHLSFYWKCKLKHVIIFIHIKHPCLLFLSLLIIIREVLYFFSELGGIISHPLSTIYFEINVPNSYTKQFTVLKNSYYHLRKWMRFIIKDSNFFIVEVHLTPFPFKSFKKYGVEV